MERGRLQTLPLGYDVRKREWFDMALSGVRHLPGQSGGAPVAWRDWRYTFNTSCYGCHVSQIDTGYDQQTDTYATTWKEPYPRYVNGHVTADIVEEFLQRACWLLQQKLRTIL